MVYLPGSVHLCEDYSCLLVPNNLLKVKMTSRTNCCVPGCNSVYKKNPNLTFHHFPNEGQRVEHIGESGMATMVDRKKLWEIKLKIGKRVTKNMRVCSKHFVEEDFVTPSDWGYQKRYLKKTAVPSRNLPVSSIITKSKSLKIEEKKKRYEKLIERREVNQLPSTSKDEMISNSFSDFDGAKALLDLQQQELPFDEDTFKETSHSMKMFVDVGTQTEDISDHKELQDEEIQVNTNWSSVSDFIQTEKALNILTGIPSFSLLFLLVNLFTSFKKDSRCQRLSVKERVLLLFLKFKLDLTYSALGVLCGGVSVPTCKRIFQDTIEVLTSILCNFVYLPPKEDVLKNMPICFSRFQNVRIVLDCTEIKVQVPKKLCCKIKLYSHYKKNHTLKFMTAVTPAGFIAYASPSYGGRASDKSIFEQSQIVEQLIPYVDEVMVDKGFLIESLCGEFGIKIIRPPFLRKKKQFDRGEASMNRSIASARVHIERVNARIKVFRIFRNTFPLHLVPIVDNIFTIICGIVNLGSPILRDDLFLH